MKLRIKNTAQQANDLVSQHDISPLIDFFALLLEWDSKDVHEKEEKRKEVPEKI